MNYWHQFLWVIFPYIALTIFIIGHIFRYNTDQAGWSAKSSEFLEKNRLMLGSILFHYGIIFAFFGHVSGILTPIWIFETLGVSRSSYHLIALSGGLPAGIATGLGIVLLLARRASIPRISRQVELMDWISGILLLAVIAVGLFCTLYYTARGLEFDYRTSIAPWFRSLFSFVPNPEYMIDVPFAFQLHVILAFLLFMIWPFTRLVHIWSLPLEYLVRNYILFLSNIKKNKNQ